MAVVGTAHELHEKRGTRFDGSQWTYTRGWLVKTDTISDREDTVSGASGLPAFASTHPAPVAGTAYCNSIQYSQTKATGPKAWFVDATYATGETLNVNPLSEDPIISWDGETFQELLLRDANGKAIVNSAGDRYLPGLTRDADHLIAHISANVSAIPTWALTLRNAVNNASITVDGLVIASGLARTKRMRRSEKKSRNGTTFYVMSFELHIHETGWLSRPLDAGYRERDPDGKLVNIVNEGDTAPPSDPVPLDGSGSRLDDPTLDTCVFNSHTIYTTADLTSLPGIS